MSIGIDQTLTGTCAILDGRVYCASGTSGWQGQIACPQASPSSNIATSTLDTGAVMAAYYDPSNQVNVLVDYQGEWSVIPIGTPLHASPVALPSGSESTFLASYAYQTEAYVYYLDVLGQMVELSGSLFWQYKQIGAESGAPQGYAGAGIACLSLGVNPYVFYTDTGGNIVLLAGQGPSSWRYLNIGSSCSAPPASLGFGMAVLPTDDFIHVYYMDAEGNLVLLRGFSEGLWEAVPLGRQHSAPAGAYSNISACMLSGSDLRVYYVNEVHEVIEFAGSGNVNGADFTWSWSNVSQQIGGCPPVQGQLYPSRGPNGMAQVLYRCNDLSAAPVWPCGQIMQLSQDNPSAPSHWIAQRLCHVQQ